MDGQAPAGGPLAGDRGWGSAPARVLDDDFDLDEHFARLVREIDASRVQPPSEWAFEGPGSDSAWAPRSARTRPPTSFGLVPSSRPSRPRRSAAPGR